MSQAFPSLNEYLKTIADLETENERLKLRIESLEAHANGRLCPVCDACGKIYPVPVPGEAVEYCVREYDHSGPHQAKTGKVWVFREEAANAAG